MSEWLGPLALLGFLIGVVIFVEWIARRNSRR